LFYPTKTFKKLNNLKGKQLKFKVFEYPGNCEIPYPTKSYFQGGSIKSRRFIKMIVGL